MNARRDGIRPTVSYHSGAIAALPRVGLDRASYLFLNSQFTIRAKSHCRNSVLTRESLIQLDSSVLKETPRQRHLEVHRTSILSRATARVHKPSSPY